MPITTQEFASLTAAGNSAAALAALSVPVKFDPPLAPAEMLPAGVAMPACPACGEGTVFLNVCGRCGSTDPGPVCCGEYPSLRGAYVSVLAGEHSWLGCPLVAGKAA